MVNGTQLPMQQQYPALSTAITNGGIVILLVRSPYDMQQVLLPIEGNIADNTAIQWILSRPPEVMERLIASYKAKTEQAIKEAQAIADPKGVHLL